MLTLSFRTFIRTSGALGATLFALASSAHADDENLALGNPSAALPLPANAEGLPLLDEVRANNLLSEKAAYSLSYNRANGGPNWVSWHLAESDRGRSGRSNTFRPDPDLPADMQIRPTDYRGSGYDRGHLCPSGDRTSDAETNAVTFYISNMLPQTPDLNRQLWRKFEEYCRSQLRGGTNEAYIITGGVGSKARIGRGKVNVPASCWKIAVILPSGADDLNRIDAETRVAAVLMPNEDGPQIAGGKWNDYLTSVDKLEELTGYDFLSNLPKGVQDALEAKVDSGRGRAN